MEDPEPMSPAGPTHPGVTRITAADAITAGATATEDTAGIAADTAGAITTTVIMVLIITIPVTTARAECIRALTAGPDTG